MTTSDIYEERQRLLKVGERICATETCLDEPDEDEEHCDACSRQQRRPSRTEWAAQYRSGSGGRF